MPAAGQDLRSPRRPCPARSRGCRARPPWGCAPPTARRRAARPPPGSPWSVRSPASSSRSASSLTSRKSAPQPVGPVEPRVQVAHRGDAAPARHGLGLLAPLGRGAGRRRRLALMAELRRCSRQRADLERPASRSPRAQVDVVLHARQQRAAAQPVLLGQRRPAARAPELVEDPGRAPCRARRGRRSGRAAGARAGSRGAARMPLEQVAASRASSAQCAQQVVHVGAVVALALLHVALRPDDLLGRGEQRGHPEHRACGARGGTRGRRPRPRRCPRRR